MKNYSFEKPTMFKNIKKQVSFCKVNFCYFFPQKIDSWSEGWKKSTTYHFLWWRITFYYKIITHNRTSIITNPKYK